MCIYTKSCYHTLRILLFHWHSHNIYTIHLYIYIIQGDCLKLTSAVAPTELRAAPAARPGLPAWHDVVAVPRPSDTPQPLRLQAQPPGQAAQEVRRRPHAPAQHLTSGPRALSSGSRQHQHVRPQVVEVPGRVGAAAVAADDFSWRP